MPNKAKTVNSSTTIDDQLLVELIKCIRKTTVPVKGSKCLHSRLKLNGRGHVQIKYKGIKYLAHRIMGCAKSAPFKYIPYDKLTKIDASHLCGNRQCINPDHIHFENCLINQTRDCCHMFGQKEGYKCPHEPICIGCQPIL
jgi:hypothetical protein